MEFASCAERIVSSNGYEGLDPVSVERPKDRIGLPGVRKRIGPRAPEECSTPPDSVEESVPFQRQREVVPKSFPPVAEAQDFVASFARAVDHGANGSVEAGAVTAPGKDTESHAATSRYSRRAVVRKRYRFR
jgi:hypothetical protein